MKRAILALILVLCTTAAWGQVPAFGPYGYAYAPYAYGGWPYGYGGFGSGGYGIGFGYGYGGFGYAGWPLAFGARGYYPPNPYGNMNWLPPVLPSPYFSVPTDRQYVQQTIIRDQQTIDDLTREHKEKE